jgi:hypothetical protein
MIGHFESGEGIHKRRYNFEKRIPNCSDHLNEWIDSPIQTPHQYGYVIRKDSTVAIQHVVFKVASRGTLLYGGN